MEDRKLATLAAANMRVFKERRAKVLGGLPTLVFPTGKQLVAEQVVQEAVLSDSAIWAWRYMEGPAYFAPLLKRYGFHYVFNGTLLVAESANHAPCGTN